LYFLYSFIKSGPFLSSTLVVVITVMMMISDDDVHEVHDDYFNVSRNIMADYILVLTLHTQPNSTLPHYKGMHTL
jgi:hypothetical protein